ncbi:MAG: aminotransferase class III-fold pyridoxal phosphate-dependent enzyme [Acidobacteria bacterium]|nr:aminotransferase class III-fold pyridoxal phosphate-dependent enzyme [Acidobacteriota bacterium]
MFWYTRRLDSGLVVMHARPEHAEQLEALQPVCFPTLADEERFKARHYRKHLEIFDEGQFVALDGDRVVGATATIRMRFDFDHIGHTFADIIQGGWLTSHEPDGDWLYGADIGVDPTYRGQGLATALYAARQELVWRRGLKGQVTGGMLRGYGAVKHEMSAEDYYAGVVAGRLKDATLSMQLGLGFEPRALLKDYLQDPVSDNYSALIVLDAAKDVTGASRELAGRYVRLTTAVPGPRAKAVLERRAAALPSGLGKATDVVVERAHGSLIVDVDGNTFIDMASGIGVTGVGHAPAEVVDAVAAQTAKYLHTCSLVTTYEPMVRLAEVLNELTPGTFAKKTIFANSGAEAVENAVKLARKATGRPAVICFEGGYHGRTLLTLTLTSKYGLFKSGFGPFASDIVRLPIPHVYRTPAGMTEEQYVDFGIRQLEQALVAQVEPSAVAAVIIEPVQGEAGFIPVPPRFLGRLRELCTEHGIVMIADEVQCGMGRTGRVFASEHYGLVPDLVVSAKSLGGGMPIGAVTGRADIMDAAHPGGVGGTYGGNPVACVAALAAVELIRQPAFLAHARHLGDVMREVMTGWQRAHPIVGDVRGLGPMMLVEFVKDRHGKAPATPDDTLAIVKGTVARGVVLMRAGLYSNGVRLLPPLTMPEDMLREALEALGASVAVVSERLMTTSA